MNDLESCSVEAADCSDDPLLANDGEIIDQNGKKVNIDIFHVVISSSQAAAIANFILVLIQKISSDYTFNNMTVSSLQMRECPLCYMRQPVHNFPKLIGCNHRSCRLCLMQVPF